MTVKYWNVKKVCSKMLDLGLPHPIKMGCEARFLLRYVTNLPCIK